MPRIGLQRAASQIRLVVSDALQNKLADPRLERLASVTSVSVSADMAFADVRISVMGTDAQQRTYMTALDRAHGLLQSMVAKRLRSRTCPTLRFHLDKSLKKSLETLELINKTMADDGCGEEQQGGCSGDDQDGSCCGEANGSEV